MQESACGYNNVRLRLTGKNRSKVNSIIRLLKYGQAMTIAASANNRTFRRSGLLALLLSATVSVPGQIRIAAISGWHAPLAGPLASHWNSGVDMGLALEIPVRNRILLRNAIRYSRHAYSGDITSISNPMDIRKASWNYIVPVLSSPTPSVIPTFENDGTEAYDIIAEVRYHVQVSPGLEVLLSSGGSLSVVRYGDIRYYIQGQNIPPFFIPDGVARIIFKPDTYLSHTISLGVRFGIFHPLDIEVDAQAFTNYNRRSSISADVGIGFAFD
jgi:hypothetical protein